MYPLVFRDDNRIYAEFAKSIPIYKPASNLQSMQNTWNLWGQTDSPDAPCVSHVAIEPDLCCDVLSQTLDSPCYDAKPVLCIFPGITNTWWCLQALSRHWTRRIQGHVVLFYNRGMHCPQTKKRFTLGNTRDSHKLVHYISRRFPLSDLFAYGASAGAMNLARYVCSYPKSNIRAAVAVCGGFHFADSQPSWFIEKIIDFTVQSSVRQSVIESSAVDNKTSKIKINQEFLDKMKRLSKQQLSEIPTQPHLNALVNDGTVSAPLDNKKYNDSVWTRLSEQWSCVPHVHKLRTPLLFINSLDDSVFSFDPLFLQLPFRNPYVAMLLTHSGGHVLFPEATSLQVDTSWPQRVALLFFNTTLAIQLASQRKNVFIAGLAGTGKSAVLKEIRRILCTRHNLHVIATATAGNTAANFEGITTHSFLGLGMDLSDMDSVHRKMYQIIRTQQESRWTHTDVLLIDELGMLDPHVLFVLDVTLRVARRQPLLVFGGMQIVGAGDFSQLAPMRPLRHNYAFQHPDWSIWFPHTCFLFRSFRSHIQGDLRFQTRQESKDETDDRLHLTTRKVDSTEINETHLSRLDSTTEQVYTSTTRVTKWNPVLQQDVQQDHAHENHWPAPVRNFLYNMNHTHLAKPRLALRHRAQVILVTSGSRGTVVGFTSGPHPLPIVGFYNGQEITIRPHTWSFHHDTMRATYTQLPLQLAWSMTIYKCQGLTIDGPACVDLSGCRSPGQAHTALSRFTSLDQVEVRNAHPSVLRSVPAVVNYCKPFLEFVRKARQDALDVFREAVRSNCSIFDPRAFDLVFEMLGF